MSRKPRFDLPGVPQHVIQRGHNREPCFYAEADYLRYLDNLQEAADTNRVRVHAYVLMTNHVHLLVTPMQPHGTPHMMQDLGRKFVRYMNHTYRRTGSMWEGRYKCSLVDSHAYLLSCMRYIELNPVRAKMVTCPGEYRWSSYGTNAGDRDDPLLSEHPIYTGLAESTTGRRHAYRALFRMHFTDEELRAVREALNQELVLGRDDFKDKIEQMLKRQVRPGIPGRPCVGEDEASYLVI